VLNLFLYPARIVGLPVIRPNPQQPQDIPRVMKSKFGLEILSPSGA
jgi:hypothetical protein